MVDAAFTDIKNIQSGLTGNRIQGGFYGPGHGEAAGVFQQSGMVGAFGAKGQ